MLAALEQIEDFRNLAQAAQQIITSTAGLKKAKREQGFQLTPAQKRTQSETAKLRREIREKLQKFVANVPVFMYVTDFCEALKDVIESLDTALFERVTGLTVGDFRLLNSGVFNAQHMNAAVYQFKSFETASPTSAASGPARPWSSSGTAPRPSKRSQRCDILGVDHRAAQLELLSATQVVRVDIGAVQAGAPLSVR